MSDIDTGIVQIHGKDYQTVARRLKEMRNEHHDWRVNTEMLHADDEGVVMKASIIDSVGNVFGTGHAEEKRASSALNKASALENCETSAVGRALANAGYLGIDIASAEEMEEHRSEAIVTYFVNYLATVRRNWGHLNQFKLDVVDLDLSSARDMLSRRVGDEDMRVLWKAPSKGSVFETRERDRTGSSPLEDPEAHERESDNVKMGQA